MVIIVEVTVHEVYRQGGVSSTNTVVVLKAQDQERYLPIWINFPQALAMAHYLQFLMKKREGLKDQRPDTYSLMAQLVERLGGRVDAIHVASLEHTIYYATVRLVVSNAMEEVDCRPSDALPLAMEVDAPIFVGAEVLAQHGLDDINAFETDFSLHSFSLEAAT